MMTTGLRHRPLNVVLAPRSKALEAYSRAAGLDTHDLATGFKPRPDLQLTFHGGRTISDLSVKLIYLGGAGTWDSHDRASIDTALGSAMTDPGLNDILGQYFDEPVTTTMLPSQTLHTAGGTQVFKDDVESTVATLATDGAVVGADPGDIVICVLLPKGVVLVDGNSDGTADRNALGDDDDAASSAEGLGGYHGSIHQRGATHYYAVAVYSDGDNGIAAFAQPWKNIVATLYHELCEARTDPDVEDAAHRGPQQAGLVQRQRRRDRRYPLEARRPRPRRGHAGSHAERRH